MAQRVLNHYVIEWNSKMGCKTSFECKKPSEGFKYACLAKYVYIFFSI